MSTILRSEPPEPVTLETDAEPTLPPPPAKGTRRMKIALRAFVGMFVAVLGCTAWYMMSRRMPAASSAPVAQTAAVTAASTPTPAPAPTTAVAEKETLPSPPPVQPHVEVKIAEPTPVKNTPVQPPPPAPPQQQQQQQPKQQPPPAPVVVAEAATPAPATLPPPGAPLSPQLERPEPNRMYLQVGSIEKGVAEVLSQGLRFRGIRSTVAPGVTPIVYRIIVGPFDTNAERDAANKILNDLGFRPFPRRFSPEELQKAVQSAQTPPVTPDVRR